MALDSQGREPLVRIGQTYVERRSRGIGAVLRRCVVMRWLMWWFALGLVRPANGRGLPFYSLGLTALVGVGGRFDAIDGCASVLALRAIGVTGASALRLLASSDGSIAGRRRLLPRRALEVFGCGAWLRPRLLRSSQRRRVLAFRRPAF